jgi:HPt (histidine-containing phosphotransfer) domain-containing protein
MKTDLTYLKNVSGGNNQLIMEMAKIFTEQVADYSTEMKKCLETENWSVLSRIAHKAKTAVAIMGMPKLTDDMRTLELSAKEAKNTDSYADYVGKFIEESNIAVIELKEVVQKLK